MIHWWLDEVEEHKYFSLSGSDLVDFSLKLELPSVSFDSPDPRNHVVQQFESLISEKSGLVSENSDAFACQELREDNCHNQEEPIEHFDSNQMVHQDEMDNSHERFKKELKDEEVAVVQNHKVRTRCVDYLPFWDSKVELVCLLRYRAESKSNRLLVEKTSESLSYDNE